MTFKKLVTLLCLTAAALFWSGCTSTDLVRVKPWERATLTSYSMRSDRDPVHTMMMEHTYFSREIASGAEASAAAGVGVIELGIIYLAFWQGPPRRWRFSFRGSRKASPRYFPEKGQRTRRFPSEINPAPQRNKVR